MKRKKQTLIELKSNIICESEAGEVSSLREQNLIKSNREDAVNILNSLKSSVDNVLNSNLLEKIKDNSGYLEYFLMLIYYRLILSHLSKIEKKDIRHINSLVITDNKVLRKIISDIGEQDENVYNFSLIKEVIKKHYI